MITHCHMPGYIAPLVVQAFLVLGNCQIVLEVNLMVSAADRPVHAGATGTGRTGCATQRPRFEGSAPGILAIRALHGTRAVCLGQAGHSLSFT